MLDWLYRLLGAMLSFFESFTGSYAIALLLYALVFKIVFLPFSIKQQKNQIAMAKLTPKIENIRAKYKGRTDQRTMQKMNQEIMELQQKEGASPMAGCLPLLIQLPLIMLLYAVIQNPLSYIAKSTDAVNRYNDSIGTEAVETDEFLTKYYGDIIEKGEKIELDDIILAVYKEVNTDLTQEEEAKLTAMPKNQEINLIKLIDDFIEDKNSIYSSTPELATPELRRAHISSFGLNYDTIPNFKLFGKNLAETPSFRNFSVLVLIPILAAAAQWLTMYLTRKINKTGTQTQAQDAQAQMSMKMMDIFMPLMTLWFAFNFSGMLGLYWIYQSLLGLLQTFILAKAMPMPQFTEAELKQIEKERRETEKYQREVAKTQPKYRSLHYIDDEDYEVLPEAPKSEGKSSTVVDGEIPEIKD